MTPNTNPKTGIRYGCVSLAQLDQEQFDPWEDGVDVSYINWVTDRIVELETELKGTGLTGEDLSAALDQALEKEEPPEFDEPLYESRPDSPVKWEMFWLGGAPHLMVLESPHTDLMAECSPCVPRAGNIGTTGETRAYTVPPEWLRK